MSKAPSGNRTFSGFTSLSLNFEESNGGYKTSTFESLRVLKVSRKTFFVKFELTRISSAAPVETSSNQSRGRRYKCFMNPPGFDKSSSGCILSSSSRTKKNVWFFLYYERTKWGNSLFFELVVKIKFKYLKNILILLSKVPKKLSNHSLQSITYLTRDKLLCSLYTLKTCYVLCFLWQNL